MVIDVHYNNCKINSIYCDRFDEQPTLKTMRFFLKDELITSFPLRRIEKFELKNEYNEYYLNIVGEY